MQRYPAELDPERLALAAAGALPDVLVDAVVTEDAVVYVEAGAVLGAAL